MGRNWKFSILYKLILMFMLVITPLYALSLIITERGKESISDEISASLESRVQFYVGTLNVEVERMVQLQKEYVVDKDLQRLAFAESIMDEYEWSQRVLSIESKLRVIQSSSAYIQAVQAYLPGNGYSISTKGSALEAIQPAEYDALSASLTQAGSPLFYWDGRFFINRGYLDPLLFQQKESYILSAELSTQAIEESLAQFTNYEDSGAVLMNIEEGWTIAGPKARPMLSHLGHFLEGIRLVEGNLRTSTMEVEDASYLVTYTYSPLLDATLIVYVPENEVLGALDTYQKWFWLLSLVSAVIVIVFSFWIYRLIHQPLTVLVRSFRNVERGQLEAIVQKTHRDEFGYLYNQFNAMIERLKELIHTVYEQKIRAQSSELKQLQSQINPHFLYNTYFILYRLAKSKDLESVICFTQHLGEYFQYITRNATGQVQLEMEVKHTRTYIDIQTTRFSDRIEATIEELPEVYRRVLVPRLCLQPIVENAYKYGMECTQEDGRIELRFRAEADRLFIIIEDNGPGMMVEELEKLQLLMASKGDHVETTGLINVHRQLQLMYGTESGIIVSRGALGGLKVELAIPMKLQTPTE